ncbi:branched-chain amino acid ABC transporter permease [Kaistia sp. 32K]|uniref:branched-chain amino acid ABC transporter permease n=1 Tax=Kaistia sp. 32K TaxID=2795690 RepID=UPI00191578FB|nr:branched-chain amino acid ABC transporter permease [Kaistia sp. 32K]BCP53343.1 branched-chain amino acid ABC transporter permease [Kaistia sp. 32K]
MVGAARPAAIMALVICAAALLAACNLIDRQQARVCVAVATAVAPAGQRVTIQSVIPLEGVSHALRVNYTVPSMDLPLYVDCAFAGGTLEMGRGQVIGVRGYDGALTERQLITLHRWFLDQDGAVSRAIAETNWQSPSLEISSIKLPKGVGFALQQVFNILSLAALYSPIALAFALVYGLIRRIHMAFGQIAVIGGYGAIIGIVAAVSMPSLGLLPSIALVLGMAVTLAALWGWLVGRTVVLPLAGGPDRAFIIATIGLGIALSEMLRLTQGAREIWVQPILDTPVVLTQGPFPVVLTEMRLLVIGLALVILPIVLFVMHHSTFGRAWRAVADDRVMARLQGIDPAQVTGTTLILASSLAAGGGAVLALSYGTITYSMGLIVGLKALLASLVGGAGSLVGAVLGGLLIATLETLWAAYFDTTSRDIVVLAILTLLFLIRPNGLLGQGTALEEDRAIRPS